MSNRLKLAIITKTSERHIYFVNRMSEKFNVAAVFQQIAPKKTIIKKISDNLVKYHFNIFKLAKILFNKIIESKKPIPKADDSLSYGPLGQKLMLNKNTELFQIADINSAETVSKMQKINPDLIVVCGGKILKKQILEVPSKGVINGHSGLTQFYRGAHSPQWAILNKKPERIGVTVHYVDTSIDGGKIIHQARPKLDKTDSIESIIKKLFELSTDLIIRTINEIENGDTSSFEMTKATGRLYFLKDWSPEKDKLAHEMCPEVLNNYLTGRDKK